jgi:sensor histidine kinase YesM
MLPLSVIFGAFLFGNGYFADWKTCIVVTLVMFAITGSAFLIYGFVAILLRNRFPREDQLAKRLIISVVIFVLLSAVLLSVVLRGFEMIGFLGYHFSEADFTKSFLVLVVMNVFLTFLEEGVSRFEQYKATVKETEELKKEYMQSQLLSLKSQVNPHFLFNGLNTLSSLINENPEKAERFLDELSKVYRYLLKNSEEQLVPLKTELTFISSYYHLLKARYGDGIELVIEVPEEEQELLIPPLTLQIIFENTLSQNSISKNQPLQIYISFNHPNWLEIRNNNQARLTNSGPMEKGLENISNKYVLLGQPQMHISNSDKERAIRLPLIPNKQMSPA